MPQNLHRWSQLFIPTLREAPADAEVASHKLLLRGGYIRQLGAGIYSYLPLGQRAINKIVAIVREEMDTIGQEFLLPTIHPKEIWEASGRWTGMGDNMFRLKDRKGADLCLGMTHEEVMTDIARSELRSYKQLPQIWYQIQTKFRDEPRPKSGLLRVRQFLMKDAYSFDIDEAGLDASYDKHDAVYRRIFDRCGLEYVAVEADSGSMGGSQSQEFMVYTNAGEDEIASSASGYAANLEKAVSVLAPVEDLAPTGDGLREDVHTPGKKSIEEVSAFLGIPKKNLVKTLIFVAHKKHLDQSANIGGHLTVGSGFVGQQYFVVLLRGDHSLNEAKFSEFVTQQGWDIWVSADPADIVEDFHAPVGFLGPVNLQLDKGDMPDSFEDPIFVLDSALVNRSNLVVGANKLDYHYRNVTPGRDFTPTVVADIRKVLEGELDPIGQKPLKLGKAVEIGHIFKLGYKYSKSMGAAVLNKDGKEVTPIMGSYGIGIERILTAAIETSAAKFASNPESKPGTESYVLPPAIAPFEVVVTITNVKESDLLEAGEKIAAELASAGFDVLIDDRDERAGVKFKDAELIGIPYRINIGKKLAEGKVELVDRLRNQTHEIALGDIIMTLADMTAKMANETATLTDTTAMLQYLTPGPNPLP